MSKEIALSSDTSKQPPASLAAAEIVSSNADLLAEILVRIPAKLLIKFKSVSKQWLSLISNPQFCHNHTTHQNHLPLPSGLYFYSTKDSSLSLNERITGVSLDGRPRTSLPNFSFLDGAGSGFETNLIHSSNGLILCSIGEKSKDYVVCNLTTQKFVVLPTLGVESKSCSSRKPYLVFDPKKSPYYKVAIVDLVFHLNTFQFQFAVYSSESGSWKTAIPGPRVPTPRLGMPIPNLGLGAVWNGAIILMSCRGGLQTCARHDHCFFRCDTDGENLNITQLPPPDTDRSKEFIYFEECGGCLLLIQIASYNATEFRVLEMMDRENNFQWTVKYVGDLTQIIWQGIQNCKFAVVSVMKVGANENDLAVVFYSLGKVVQYNIECKTLKVLCDLSGGNIPRHSYHFIESLTPI